MKLEALLAHRFPPQRIQYGPKDAILYALSVGAGSDPVDPAQLQLVYEQGLKVLPTLAAVLAHPGAWIANPLFQVNFLKLLHGEQDLTVHQPLPASGEVEATYRVQAVVDKGEDKGALVYFEKQLRAAGSGDLLCTVSSTLFLRADGGCGSFGMPPEGLPGITWSRVDFSDQLTTPLNSALLYRLNGDLNPIHADPVAARKAGFERPILHGLCTYGVAGYLLTRSVCGHDPAGLKSLGARFSAPVYPGETIRIEGCRSDGAVHFQASVPERQTVVLSQGYARIA
jgi:acyl dehydratase